MTYLMRHRPHRRNRNPHPTRIAPRGPQCGKDPPVATDFHLSGPSSAATPSADTATAATSAANPAPTQSTISAAATTTGRRT